MTRAFDDAFRKRHWEEIQCSLVVHSQTVTAVDVTAHVGIEPTTQRVKGEPISAKRPNIPVAGHLWVWKPTGSIEHSLDAQLDAIWAALSSRADAFRSLPPDAEVGVSIWIVHHGSELRLGWALDQRHVTAAAAFGASIDVDEYDDTES